MTEQEPRIFLCHANEDKERVRGLYRQLKAAGYHPWLDEEDLLPGVDWELEIRRAIRSSKLFLACLSKESIDKRGYVQKEIKIALDVLDEMPEGKIYLIPVRLEECEVPARLGSRQWVDLFEPNGFEKLKRALDYEFGLSPAAPIEPEMVLIPAGEFLMGSDPKKDKDAFDHEQPQHTVYLPEYYIAKTPVTNAQYLAFVQATLCNQPGHWPKILEPPPGEENHPVVDVDWHDAMAYCRWLAETTGKAYRLPTEAEWEKAARATDGRIYPWGDEPPDENRCNFDDYVKDITPVGQYSPQGDSPYGCVDMVGNVLEWTLSLWGKKWGEPDYKYPYDPTDGREDLKAGDEFLWISRGGAFYGGDRSVRCASRIRSAPFDTDWSSGFRVVIAPGYASDRGSAAAAPHERQQ